MGENSKIEWTDHTFNLWIGFIGIGRRDTKLMAFAEFCHQLSLQALKQSAEICNHLTPRPMQ